MTYDLYIGDKNSIIYLCININFTLNYHNITFHYFEKNKKKGFRRFNFNFYLTTCTREGLQKYWKYVLSQHWFYNYDYFLYYIFFFYFVYFFILFRLLFSYNLYIILQRKNNRNKKYLWTEFISSSWATTRYLKLCQSFWSFRDIMSSVSDSTIY